MLKAQIIIGILFISILCMMSAGPVNNIVNAKSGGGGKAEAAMTVAARHDDDQWQRWRQGTMTNDGGGEARLELQ